MYLAQDLAQTSDALVLDCPSCGLPAQVVDSFTLPGAPEPVEHVKLVCVAGHWFTPTSDSLPMRPRGIHEHDTRRRDGVNQDDRGPLTRQPAGRGTTMF